jgi:hypothetical protein
LNKQIDEIKFHFQQDPINFIFWNCFSFWLGFVFGNKSSNYRDLNLFALIFFALDFNRNTTYNFFEVVEYIWYFVYIWSLFSIFVYLLFSEWESKNLNLLFNVNLCEYMSQKKMHCKYETKATKLYSCYTGSHPSCSVI